MQIPSWSWAVGFTHVRSMIADKLSARAITYLFGDLHCVRSVHMGAAVEGFADVREV